MAKAALTKSQRRRENERRRILAAKPFQEEIGARSARTAELVAALGSNLAATPLEQLEPWEKAPAHLVDYDEQPSLKVEELNRMSRLASEKKRDERDVAIGELKLRYRNLWGKRGAARIIAQRETRDENPLSERTVQNYFKITKIQSARSKGAKA